MSEQVYAIHNPSDPYTIKGEFIVAAVAVALLGNGQYGIDGSPILWGWDAWLKEHGIDDLDKYVEDNLEQIATALESVLIGSQADREEVEFTMGLLPEADCHKWIETRHEKRRSSMNDIGGCASSLAASLRASLAERGQA